MRSDRTPIKRVCSRITSSRLALQDWKSKSGDLRRLVAGDFSVVDWQSPVQDDNEAPHKRQIGDENANKPVLVRLLESGSTNYLARQVRTLAQQVAARMPSIEFENVDPGTAALMTQYLALRLGPKPNGCDAEVDLELALMDEMIIGLGAIWCTVDQFGRPEARYVDPLDMFWDQMAKSPKDARWLAVECSMALSDALELYPDAEPLKKIEPKDDTMADDAVSLVWYWDVDGIEGTAAVLMANTLSEGGVLEHSPNPHVMTFGQMQEVYLPIVLASFMQLPQVNQPIGLVEGMVPHQMLARQLERYQQKLAAMPPFYQVTKGTLDEANQMKLLSGQAGVLVEVEGGPSIMASPGMEAPRLIHELLAQSKQEATSESGANPYASGQPVQGTRFAAEAHAIQASASLMAGTLRLDHADTWRRVAQITLVNGQLFDQGRITLRVDEDELNFGPDEPIGLYLKPDAKVLVQPESAGFEDKNARMSLARMKMQVAMEAAAVAPGAPKLAYEDFLRASGEANPAKFFEGGMMAPMTDSGQMAATTLE